MVYEFCARAATRVVYVHARVRVVCACMQRLCSAAQHPAPYISCCISRHLAGSLFSNMYWNISRTAVAALSECRMGTPCRAQMAAYLLVRIRVRDRARARVRVGARVRARVRARVSVKARVRVRG